MRIFEYSDYKRYLREVLTAGRKARFAEFIGCQASFLSQVLNANPDLSLEQGLLANEFLNHSKHETEQFMLLLEKSRAGSVKLKNYYQKKLDQNLNLIRKVSSQISDDREIEEDRKLQYYSSWIYPVIHVLVSIPCENQIEFLSNKTNLSLEKVNEALHFLTAIKLISFQNNKYVVTNRRVHLPSDSQYISAHHRNFRNKSIQKIDLASDENLHFSSVFALSSADAENIRKHILQLVRENEKILIPSKEEVVYIFNLDWIKM